MGIDDWAQIVELYDDSRADRSPVVAMNRAIAVSRVDGALSGLAALDAIENRAALDRYHCCRRSRPSYGERPATSIAQSRVIAPRWGWRARAPEQRWLTSRLSLLV